MTYFTTELTETLAEYSKLASGEVDRICEEVADETLQMVRRSSAKRTGKYARSWKKKVTKKANGIEITIHNTQASLTHLLEFGHRTRRKYSGKSHTSAQAHIAPAEEFAKRELETRIKKALGG